MTSKRLRTRTKIFFPNPHVVRLEYGEDVGTIDAETDYRKIISKTYRLTKGTWGYTTLDYEFSRVKNDLESSVFNGINLGDTISFQRCYFCFKDELDALQFRLSINTRAVQVKMWPSRWFTIHEVVETDEP